MKEVWVNTRIATRIKYAVLQKYVIILIIVHLRVLWITHSHTAKGLSFTNLVIIKHTRIIQIIIRKKFVKITWIIVSIIFISQVSPRISIVFTSWRIVVVGCSLVTTGFWLWTILFWVSLVVVTWYGRSIIIIVTAVSIITGLNISFRIVISKLTINNRCQHVRQFTVIISPSTICCRFKWSNWSVIVIRTVDAVLG